ncbi:hypothetical protein SAY87_025601 [Trapa incisa]|uniref:Uncharacterized protein n=1 Tax=Trapa incisa TaxID=236973 RepID=A0AAN7GYD2_9MYRT|nr:hypothetical protein SAY87_025601 [Trapa incisa]
MAVRMVSQTLLRRSTIAPWAIISPNLRHRSSLSGKLIEVDLESSPSIPSSSDGEVEVLKMRKLEEAIHALFVEKSTPDWLPFIPGSSFWVPPRKRPVDVVDLVEKLMKQSIEEETLNFTSSRGWPALEFLSSKDGAPETVLELEVEVEADKDDIQDREQICADTNSESKDREG